MENIKKVLLSNKMKTVYWQFANLGVLFVITLITGLNWVYAPMLLPVLNSITKYINQTYI